MRILVVDDHEIVREGLIATLAADPRFEVVGAAGSAAEALEQARRTLPDVALVDLRLPDISGEDLCRSLRERFPSTAVVILTTYLSEETVRGAMNAGATAYVTKSAGLPELRKVLERVRVHGVTPDPTTGPQIVKQLHELVSSRVTAALPTPQQERVLELAAEGLTYEDIGARLYISESTVRFHVQKLKVKFGARTKIELIAKAIRSGVISPAPDDLGVRS